MMIRKITCIALSQGTIDTKTAPWPQISDAAKDCVLKLLTRDPNKRPTATEILQVIAHSSFITFINIDSDAGEVWSLSCPPAPLNKDDYKYEKLTSNIFIQSKMRYLQRKISTSCQMPALAPVILAHQAHQEDPL